MMRNRIVFHNIFNTEVDELSYSWTPEAIAEWNLDFEKLVEAHAKYNRNKNGKI